MMAYSNLVNNMRFSWFITLRVTASMYRLPDPLHILMVPPHKLSYKRLVHSCITSYWTGHLSTKAAAMPRLLLLRTPSLSLGCGPQPVSLLMMWGLLQSNSRWLQGHIDHVTTSGIGSTTLVPAFFQDASSFLEMSHTYSRLVPFLLLPWMLPHSRL